MLDARILDVLVQWRRRTPGVPTCNIAAPVVYMRDETVSQLGAPRSRTRVVDRPGARHSRNAECGGHNNPPEFDPRRWRKDPAAAASLLMRFQTPEGENEQERKETSEESDETSVPSACGQSENRVRECGCRLVSQKDRRAEKVERRHGEGGDKENPSRRNLAVTTFLATDLIQPLIFSPQAALWAVHGNGMENWILSASATSYPCPPTPFTLAPVSSPAITLHRRAPLQPEFPPKRRAAAPDSRPVYSQPRWTMSPIQGYGSAGARSRISRTAAGQAVARQRRDFVGRV
ncbi:hypothetical protein FB45DRAFT_1015539 [Roridomyces roridus]|uniref:Uncharacterized protein n=1 Tax=Roridomyces roridus TaxID=1738132 RepID=A0AAD7AX42_9AGAR|nr:hypothetical protein FB45DRAFT_1015539 [Roridomyces roridus]